MYNPGSTIAETLAQIQHKGLPAIQREFVWKPEQLEKLFDSVMQAYLFGTFLFWKLQALTGGKFKFYDFVLNYHRRDAAHCPELDVMQNQSVAAVLDGQLRLAVLNIGPRGSMVVKQPNKWWTNPDAFSKRVLRLDFLASSSRTRMACSTGSASLVRMTLLHFRRRAYDAGLNHSGPAPC